MSNNDMLSYSLQNLDAFFAKRMILLFGLYRKRIYKSIS